MGMIIRNNFGGGWKIEMNSRAMAVALAEKVQDSDTLLYVESVTLRYGSPFPSEVTVKGDGKYEEELKDMVRYFSR